MFQSNIIKWYTFEKDKKIIQIGTNESITNELKKISKNVKCICDAQEITNEINYDYVIIYGYENCNIKLENIVNLLSEDGKLLIIGNNGFGINNWSKYCQNSEAGVLKLEKHNEKAKTIYQIKKELQEFFVTETNSFYVFPNYKNAEIIINEKFNIEKGHIEKYKTLIEENEIKVFDETKVLKNILKNNPQMLEFFTNSYFIEASKKKINTDIRLVSYNNWRKEQYRLITIIQDEIVRKIPATEKAQKHINNMKKIISNVKESGIEILDYEENGTICSKYIKDTKTLDEILNENYDNLDDVVKILNDIKTILLKDSDNYDEYMKKIDLKEQEKIEKLHFIKNAFWDMVPKNCFYIDNKYVFFDQEWNKECLPVEFIIYRSVINSYDLVRQINVDELLEKLDILQYKDYFEKLDEELRKEIIDDKIYNQMYCKKITAIDNLINDRKIAEMCLEHANEDNRKKQEYIEQLEEENRRKQEYIINLEESNKNKQEYIKEIEERRKSFWKR